MNFEHMEDVNVANFIGAPEDWDKPKEWLYSITDLVPNVTPKDFALITMLPAEVLKDAGIQMGISHHDGQ